MFWVLGFGFWVLVLFSVRVLVFCFSVLVLGFGVGCLGVWGWVCHVCGSCCVGSIVCGFGGLGFGCLVIGDVGRLTEGSFCFRFSLFSPFCFVVFSVFSVFFWGGREGFFQPTSMLLQTIKIVWLLKLN